MPLASRLVSLYRTLFRGASLDAELDAELRASVDELTDRGILAGLPPDAARRAALLELGGLEQVKERVRDLRTGHALDTCWHDVRHATRTLRRSPAFTTTAVLTMAIGVGAASAVFSVVNAVLIRPLPYRDADRLVFVWSDLTQAGYPRGPHSGPELHDLRDRNRTLAALGGIWPTSAALTGEGDPEQIRVGLVTSNFFPVLGVDAHLGRTFDGVEEGPGAAPTILLSWPLWQRRFAGNPHIVGNRVRVNGDDVTVVGVLPREFRLLFPPDANVPDELQAFVPFTDDLRRAPRSLYYLRIVGRLRPGASFGEAQQEIERIGESIARQYTDYSTSGRRFFVVQLHADTVRLVRPTLLALFIGVMLLLAVACINVGGLLVARAAVRGPETAMRVALGASRSRLLRQYLTEGLLLASMAAATGLAVGYAALRLLHGSLPASLERVDAVRLDPRVIVFAIVAALVWGILFSLAPMSEVGRADPADTLRRRSQRAGTRLDYRLRSGLVVAQIALGVMLLVGAGLTFRSLRALQRIDVGFQPSGVLSFRIALPPNRYRTLDSMTQFSRRLEERVRALPGVTAVGAVSHVPYDDLPNWSSPYFTDRSDDRTGREADARAVSPGFFAAVGATIMRGRGFLELDDEHAPRVVVVDELLARRAWSDGDAVGRRLKVDFIVDDEFVPTWATVVGVARHLRYHTPTEEIREQVYLPVRQAGRNPMAYVVRTGRDPARLRDAIVTSVSELDPELPVYDVRTLADYVSGASEVQRFTSLLAATLAGLALLLAVVGVYGITSYMVASRRREFGIRLAMGAAARRVAGIVIGESVRMCAAGVAVGLVAASIATRFLRSALVGVSPRDPWTYVTVCAVLVIAALAATWVPVRRALRVNPIEILRSE